jgi:hypothetical protein
MEENDRKAHSPTRFEGRFQRISGRVRELSLLARAAAVAAASVIILLTMAFGSGRIRVSTEGVELQPREAVGAVSDNHSRHSIASPSVRGSIYLIFAPRTVRLCNP